MLPSGEEEAGLPGIAREVGTVLASSLQSLLQAKVETVVQHLLLQVEAIVTTAFRLAAEVSSTAAHVDESVKEVTRRTAGVGKILEEKTSTLGMHMGRDEVLSCSVSVQAEELWEQLQDAVSTGTYGGLQMLLVLKTNSAEASDGA